MSVVAMALALRNLEGRLARGQSVGQYSRDLLTNAAKELEHLDSALLSAMTARERSAADLGAERAKTSVVLKGANALVDLKDEEIRRLNDKIAILTKAGDKLAEDRQVQVDALLAKVADLETKLAALTRLTQVASDRYRDKCEAYSRLLVAFHDSIRRGLGVTPASGEEFYDARMADEAEARAVRYGRGRR